MSFAGLIRARQREIVARWSSRCNVDAPEELPQLLEALARAIEGAPADVTNCAGFGMTEYCILRSTLMAVAAEDSGQVDVREVAKLDAELDRLLEAAANRRAVEQRAELRALEERQRLAVEIAGLGTWDFDLRTRQAKWSARTRELFGLGPDAEISYELFIERVHPQDRAQVQEYTERAARGELGGEIWITFRVLDSDGEVRWYESRGRTAYDSAGRPLEMFGTIHDITEHKRAAELKNRYEAATLATRQLLYDWNSLTNDLTFSGRSEDILGIPLREMPTSLEAFTELIHPEDRAAFAQEIERIIATREPAHVVYRMRRRDGSYIIAEDNGRFFFDSEGKPIRMIGFVVDVTERKQIEEQRDKERHRAEALIELDRVKTEFFGNISHELRTPLTLILGPIEDALAAPDKSLDEAGLRVVYRSAVRLLRLVNHLLEFAHMELGRAQTTFVPTDLAAFTADLASSFRSLIERAGMKFVVECDVLPEPIYVDRSQWERIVLNLLSNAFKYTFAGEIALTLRWKQDHVELAVRDTGIGIPPRELEHIFERFHRVQDARGRSFEGSGIGLALVKELVGLHGGKVQVTSLEDHGSTFLVSIPTGHAHLPHERIASEGQQRTRPSAAIPYVLEASNWLVEPEQALDVPAATEEPSRRILVADDNADMREYLVRLLRAHWETEAVADGRAALRAARQRAPDLIVADVMMPRMDGLALVRALRAAPETSGVPVILLTARAGETHLLDGLEAGADDYLIKPFSARELISRIRSVLRRVDMSRAVAEAEEHARVQERLRILAEAAAALGESLDYRSTISKVAQLAVPALADFCRVDLSDDEGVMHCVEAADADARAAEVADWLKRSDVPAQLAGGPVLLDPPQNRFASAAAVRSVMAVPLQARGRSLGTLILARNGSGREYAATELAIAGELGHRCAIAIDNARLYREAQRAIHARDEFLSIASHELRTPLSSLGLALENLERRIRQDAPSELTSEWASARLAAAIRQAKRLQRLVKQLLDVSRVNDECLHLNLEPIALTRVVNDVLTQLEEEGAMSRSSCAIELRASGEPIGRWDRVRIQQIVTNLVENALKFGAGAAVEITVTDQGEQAELIVRDHGIGISSSDRARIFERFERAVAVRHFGGIGLGLWIVRQSVEAMHGSVQVESELGRGSTFIVRLPKNDSSMDAEPRTQAAVFAGNSPH
jgi:PAS domain S-box-containing protein